MNIVGEGVLAWGIGKIADKIWAHISGGGSSNALQTALSIALQEFRHAHPRVHTELFQQDAFWDAMQAEVVLLLQPEGRPDPKRLAQQVEPLAAVPTDGLARIIHQEAAGAT